MRMVSTAVAIAGSKIPEPKRMALLVMFIPCVSGNTHEIARAHIGKTSIGKANPQKNVIVGHRNWFRSLVLLIMKVSPASAKEKEDMPIIVKIMPKIATGTFAWLSKSKPNKRLLVTNVTVKLIKLKVCAAIILPISQAILFEGVIKISSKVPASCSLLMPWAPDHDAFKMGPRNAKPMAANAK